MRNFKNLNAKKAAIHENIQPKGLETNVMGSVKTLQQFSIKY